MGLSLHPYKIPKHPKVTRSTIFLCTIGDKPLFTKNINAMTHYEFLLAKRLSGELRQWYQYGLAPQTEQWMTYYEYSLSHPDESQLEIANHFGRGHSTIQRALEFMSTPHR